MQSSQLKFNVTMKQLIVVLAFGIFVMIISIAHLTIQLSEAIITDPRELFTTIGSAITGPIGGTLIAIMAGIFESSGMQWAGIPAHIVGSLWMAITYKRFINTSSNLLGRALRWVGLVLVYYLILVLPLFLALLQLFYPEIYSSFSGNTNLLQAYLATVPSVVPEMIITIITTTLVMSVLPKQYRKTLW